MIIKVVKLALMSYSVRQFKTHYYWGFYLPKELNIERFDDAELLSS